MISYRQGSFRFLTVLLCTLGILPGVGVAAVGDSFSFVVIADPHVSGSAQSTSAQNLQSCVNWVNAYRQQYNIEMSFVAGDIGFGGDGAPIQLAKSILDGLAVPYAPVVGDDDVQNSTDELRFAQTFQSVYQSLAANPLLSNWNKAPVDVWNPEVGLSTQMQSFAFDYRGIHFVCPDWCSREFITYPGHDPVRREEAELHDFAGGTLPWFEQVVSGLSRDKLDNTVMISHHPMFSLGGDVGALLASFGFLSESELQQLGSILNDPNHPMADYLYADYSGHFHSQGFMPENADPYRAVLDMINYDPNTYDPTGPIRLLPLPGYDVYIVDDTHQDLPRLELVTVTEGTTGFSYESRPIVAIPEPSTLAMLLSLLALRQRKLRRLT